MSDNWIVQNLENALKTWNEKWLRYGSSSPKPRRLLRAAGYDLYRDIHKAISSNDRKISIIACNPDDTILAFAQCKIQDSEESTKPIAALYRIRVDNDYKSTNYKNIIINKCGKWAKLNGCNKLTNITFLTTG